MVKKEILKLNRLGIAFILLVVSPCISNGQSIQKIIDIVDSVSAIDVQKKALLIKRFKKFDFIKNHFQEPCEKAKDYYEVFSSSDDVILYCDYFDNNKRKFRIEFHDDLVMWGFYYRFGNKGEKIESIRMANNVVFRSDSSFFVLEGHKSLGSGGLIINNVFEFRYGSLVNYFDLKNEERYDFINSDWYSFSLIESILDYSEEKVNTGNTVVNKKISDLLIFTR